MTRGPLDARGHIYGLPRMALSTTCYEQAHEYQGQCREQFDKHMYGGPCGILQRVSDSVSDNGRRVGRALLSSEGPGLDVFLAVVPSSPTVVEHVRDHYPCDRA